MAPRHNGGAVVGPGRGGGGVGKRGAVIAAADDAQVMHLDGDRGIGGIAGHLRRGAGIVVDRVKTQRSGLDIGLRDAGGDQPLHHRAHAGGHQIHRLARGRRLVADADREGGHVGLDLDRAFAADGDGAQRRIGQSGGGDQRGKGQRGQNWAEMGCHVGLLQAPYPGRHTSDASRLAILGHARRKFPGIGGWPWQESALVLRR